MKLLDFLTSTRHPAVGTPALSPEELLKRLMSLNRSSAPYQIVDGSSESVDLIAEWKIIDDRWSGIFGSAGVKKAFRIYMKLEAATHELRAMDREYEVFWDGGLPVLRIAASSFKGQKQSAEFGSAYAYTETTPSGQIYKYRFSTGEIKKPIQDAVTGAGWTYKGVAFGKLHK
jgi:hypothetical protein